ncbi:MAG TPA: LAGLIDADG family homing endonuclease [Candidatus Paceibacterota bacterium]|nr:LAGLIDADG family homing endonuclease [Candidatus Paceibacterota bacterium]
MEYPWTANLAYAIGLITTDGSLSKDRRHIDLTSKDMEQIDNFKSCLNLKNKIGIKKSKRETNAFRVQFGDVNFYNFLLSIGLYPNKTSTLCDLKIPSKYFFDFLRGHFDGDGTFYSYYDKRWKSSFMFYTTLISASQEHILWLRKEIRKLLNINGHITKSQNSSVYQLKFAKVESLQLLPKMYYNKHVICLNRKRIKIEKALKSADVAKLETALP